MKAETTNATRNTVFLPLNESTVLADGTYYVQFDAGSRAGAIQAQARAEAKSAAIQAQVRSLLCLCTYCLSQGPLRS